MKKVTSFPKDKIKIVLFEKIHTAARETFEQAGYSVTLVDNAVDSEELLSIVKDAHILGVRSRTKIRKEHLQAAKRLLAVGCFSVGTDQVDLPEARNAGVPVFNAPYSSTRSVAELTIGNVISLGRRIAELSGKMHRGEWFKTAEASMEVRNKTLGIIGYGHIGQQVGLLGEAIGMNVVFYDVIKKLPLGRAQAAGSMEEVRKNSDFVTLHIPGGEKNEKLIGADALSMMNPAAYLINLSRGKVVDLEALKSALVGKKLAGAALDVFPQEPAADRDSFSCELSELENVILTPHIGGSTAEAQKNIGIEVASSLIDFIDVGSTDGVVNFPQVNLPVTEGTHRILYIHRNEPGALSEVNNIISNTGANIEAQYLGTLKDVGYLIIDVNSDLSEEVHQQLLQLSKNIRTRILY